MGKRKKLSKLIEKGIVKKCKSCNGVGIRYYRGAFGETEVDTCITCNGDKYVLNFKRIKKDV